MKYSNKVGTAPVQVALGYEFASADLHIAGFPALPGSRHFNGFFIQPTFGISDYLAIVGNIDGTYHSETVDDLFFGPTSYKAGVLSYTVGPQIYPAKHSYSWQPFGRFTVGAATLIMNGNVQDYLGSPDKTQTGFAWQVGAGIDYRPRSESRIAYRVGQIDYIHGSKTFSGVTYTYTAVKFGAGITF